MSPNSVLSLYKTVFVYQAFVYLKRHVSITINISQ